MHTDPKFPARVAPRASVGDLETFDKKRSFLRRALGCDTLDDCLRIQKGRMLFRRLGKYSILFSIAFTLLINDVIAKGIDILTTQYDHAKAQYEQVTGSVLYRWTAGWLVPPHPVPKFDSRVIFIYNTLNILQFAVFVFTIAWCLRWIYADSQVHSSRYITFKNLLLAAAVLNFVIYVSLRTLIFAYLK